MERGGDQGCWPADFLPQDWMQQHPPPTSACRNLSWGPCFPCSPAHGSCLIFLSNLPWAWRWGRGLFSIHCYLQALVPPPNPPISEAHTKGHHSPSRHLITAHHLLAVLYAALSSLLIQLWSHFSPLSFPRSCNYDMSSLQTQFFSPSVSTDLFTFRLSDSKVQPSSHHCPQPPLPIRQTWLWPLPAPTPTYPLLPCCTQARKGWWGASPVLCAPFWASMPLSRVTPKYWQSCWTSLSQNDPPWIPLFLQLFHFSWNHNPLLTVFLSSEKLIKNTSILSHRLLVSLLLTCNSLYTKIVNIVFLSKNFQALKFFPL